MPIGLIYCVLFGALLWFAIEDVLWRRISWLALGIWAVGLVLTGARSLGGAMLGYALMALAGHAGGDAKIMALIGLSVGVRDVAIIAAVLSLALWLATWQTRLALTAVPLVPVIAVLTLGVEWAMRRL